MPRQTWHHIDIWESPEALQHAVARSKSLRQTLTSLGMEPSSRRYAKLKIQCDLFGIPLDFTNPRASHRRTPDDLVFTEKSVFGRNHAKELKDRALALGYVENECALCGLPATWQGRPLSLQLDHVDGDHRNNRPENLRMLCPNCHTQTETFTSKRLRNSTECRRGHTRTVDNTRINPRGYRTCLDCANLHKANERGTVKPWQLSSAGLETSSPQPPQR